MTPTSTIDGPIAKNALGYPLLQCKTPVPSDIQISQDIVKDVGLLSIADLAKQYVFVGFMDYCIHIHLLCHDDGSCHFWLQYLRLSLVVVIDRILGGFIGGLTLAVVALDALNNNIQTHTYTFGVLTFPPNL
jgi:hypothetical protein